MALRIDEAVVRGEIDNRNRGRVQGRIWLVGRAEPVILDLKGDAWRDVAGRYLVFENPTPKAMELESLSTVQDGVVGDITASRKVKVPEIPMDQIGEYYAAKKPWPWHWGNSLHLEWFSDANGRVVIESATFELRIEQDATWEMSEDEENAQKEANADAVERFMERLGQADFETENSADECEPSFGDKPMTEAEAEAEQARMDLLIDRVQARMEREGNEADFELILKEERERLRIERGEPPEPAEWENPSPDLDEMLAEAEERLSINFEPEEEVRFDLRHPLIDRSRELWNGLMHRSREENWVEEDAMEEHPVHALLNAVMCVGPKLAGALSRGDWPPEPARCGPIIVRLKRARGFIDDALAAAESCQEDNLIAADVLGPTLVDLIDLAHEIDDLIAELRQRLKDADPG